MKKIVAAITLGIILSGCSSSAQAVTKTTPVVKIKEQQTVDFWSASIQQNAVDKVVKKLKARVGKTWYVFSGATPSGWDCSGLTMWAYQQLGIEIPHSANKQAKAGTKVVSPTVGDLVLFGYKGTNTYFHAAIYVGDNKFIHAGFRKGQTTKILSLTDPSVKNTKIKFVRLLPSVPVG
jgi:cell wall-associated NlpC family hydrolase